MIDSLFNAIHEDDGIETAVLQGVVAATLTAVLESSDEDEEETQWGGSRPGKAPNKTRDFVRAYERLVSQYFQGVESIYDEGDFERRFRMPRSIFNRIADAIFGEESFVLRQDALGKNGIHPLVRLTACLRLLAYGTPPDSLDENLEISETVASDSLKEFSRIMIQKFGAQYLNRCPTTEEKNRMVRIMKRRGWPGAFASWDCKHFEWENCPVRLAGQTKGHADGGKKTLILEAIADADTYMWYVFFGEVGSLNDTNILDKSSIVGSILGGTFNVSVEPYTVNGTTRDWMYFLADGIYPDWSIFVKTVRIALNRMEEIFKTSQEGARKDIERAFGVLVKRFQYLKRPLRHWYIKDIKNILHCCIIMHNMIVECRRNEYMAATNGIDLPLPDEDQEEQQEVPGNFISLFGRENAAQDILGIHAELADRVSTVWGNVEDREKYNNLRSDLMQHKMQL
jgi:hypothetical protein